MARNILIFSDGTGQVGGYEFDEDRTNIYKLYRATRVGPDSCIDPHEQAAFYDPGLGSRGRGGFPLGRLARTGYTGKSAKPRAWGSLETLLTAMRQSSGSRSQMTEFFSLGSAAVPTLSDVSRQ